MLRSCRKEETSASLPSALPSVKESRRKGLHTVWFHLWDSLKKAKPWEQETDQWSPGAGAMGGLAYREYPGICGVDDAGGYVPLHICENSWKLHQKG